MSALVLWTIRICQPVRDPACLMRGCIGDVSEPHAGLPGSRRQAVLAAFIREGGPSLINRGRCTPYSEGSSPGGRRFLVP